MEITTKTKSASVTTEDLLPHIESARQSNDPVRRAAVVELAMMAAMTLGALPKRQRRRWTGWIGDKHVWRGRRVILPNGIIAEVYGVLRGQAAVFWSDPFWVEGTRRDVVPVDQLIVYKHPAAIVLGKLKRGCKEQPSERKGAACRANGSRPVRPGHRPRGRPRKDQE